MAHAALVLWVLFAPVKPFDRVHADVLAKNAAFRARSLGIDINALVSLPHAGQAAQRTEIGQAVRRYVVGLGEDVFGNGLHVDSLAMCSRCHVDGQTQPLKYGALV